MAKQIVWSPRAKKELDEILHYWIKRTNSNSYSTKLAGLFEQAVQLLAIHPRVGRLTDDKTARVKIIRDYLLFYEEEQDQIHILAIWDSRRDPDELKIM